ncbi:MAG TPA: head GIN domain-containing protein, partial [Bacteroidia bacterium]|nr:head GIN domain-containing protein [Bacteroidia bacterium]
LWVPKGKVVKLEEPVKELLHWKQKNKFFHTNYKGTMWATTDSGMRCLDCQPVDPASVPSDAWVTEHESFTDVEINIPAEVVIKTGDKHSVALSGPREILSNLSPVTYGGTLKFNYDRDIFDIFGGSNLSGLKIVITLNHLERLDASGATNIELVNITGENLDIEISGASKLEGEIYTGRLNMELNGASKAELEGKVQNLKVDMSGAAKLNAYDLETGNAKMDMNGACYAELFATTEITGKTSGASKIFYKGNPTLRVDISDASKIKAAE